MLQFEEPAPLKQFKNTAVRQVIGTAALHEGRIGDERIEAVTTSNPSLTTHVKVKPIFPSLLNCHSPFHTDTT